MPADVQRHVETQFTIADRATGQLNKMGSAARRVTGLFDKASATVGKFGAIAGGLMGGFDIGTAVAGAQQYLKTVRDISEMTGFAAEGVDGMLEAMYTVNIEAQEGQNIIMQMSLAMARYRMEVERVGKAQSEASLIIERMGISMEKGPQAVMTRMSELAQQQKLEMADLVIGFQMEQRAAAGLMRLLQEGPEHIRSIMEGLQKRGIAVTAENVAAFGKFEKAQLAIKSAWDRIFLVVAGKVMPVLSDFLETVASKIDAWAEKAAYFGKLLAGFLKNHLGTIIMIGKVMAANFALQKLTGVGMGGIAMKGGKMLKGVLGLGVAAQAGAAAPVAGAAAGMGRVGSFLTRTFSRIFRLPGIGRISGMFAVAGPSLLKFGSILFRFTAVGVIITAIIAMTLWTYQAITKNVMGIRDLILDFWARWGARVSAMWDTIRPLVDVIGRLFSTEGVVGRFFVKQLVRVVDFLGTAVDNMLRALQTIILVAEAFSKDFYKAITSPIQTFQDAWEKANHLAVKKRKELEFEAIAEAAAERRRGLGPPGVRQPPPVMDFRGSTFNIKQAFAEGFDPDRIAVAFSNDLATLGERRLQATTAPLFAIR